VSGKLSRPVRRARYAARALGRRTSRRRHADGLADDESLRLDMQSDSRTLLIAFGGMRGAEIGVPAFEFFAATDGLPVKRLFVRDLRQAWYQRGVPEYGETLQSVADGLRAFVEQHEVDRLVMAGNSAGGYAALAFGTMLGADAILSFAPQTVLDLDVLAAIGDHRWDAQLIPIAAAGQLDAGWIDLSKAIPRARAETTRYEVFVDEQLAVDRLHAERLETVEGLRLYRFGKGGHGLVRALREAGALQRLLGRALELDA
jgi:hypothetical protein